MNKKKKKKLTKNYYLEGINISNASEAQLLDSLLFHLRGLRARSRLWVCLMLGAHYTISTAVASFKDNGYALGAQH